MHKVDKMATAVTCREVVILKGFKRDLTNLISGETATVASRLVEVKLVSDFDDLLHHDGKKRGKKKERERANEIISQVINRVKLHPEELNTFLDVLDDISTLEKIAKEIRRAYEEKVN